MTLARKLEAYLRRQWPALSGFTIEELHQIPGGASRETYRFVARYTEAGADRRKGYIFRRDPSSSLIDTERSHEFRTYQAVFGTSVPVPEPLILENAPGDLERPFSVMAEVPDCQSATANFAVPPYSEMRRQIGEQKWSILGRLSAISPAELGVDSFMTVVEPADCARHELDYWAGVIEQDALHPQPIAMAAIRELRRRYPPPAQRLCLVHGDYRSGNFLYDEHGDIKAVLDWEMAHIGDPLEDLAWSLDPLWPWPDKTLAGGLMPRHEAITIWERASGLRVDREAFRWWQIFASLKALAIWISSSEDFANGQTKEPILAVAGWLMTDRQNRILVDRLSPVSRHRYAEAL